MSWCGKKDVSVFLPRDDHDKVHDVPRVPEVAVLVEDKPVGQDFDNHLQGEDAHEDGLQLFLRKHKTKRNYRQRFDFCDPYKVQNNLRVSCVMDRVLLSCQIFHFHMCVLETWVSPMEN